MAVLEDDITNLTYLHGFQTVHYRIFGFCGSNQPTESGVQAQIQAICSSLRQYRLLTSYDSKSSQLWIFARSSDQLNYAEILLLSDDHVEGFAAFKEIFMPQPSGNGAVAIQEFLAAPQVVSSPESSFEEGDDHKNWSKSRVQPMFISALAKPISDVMIASGRYLPLGSCLFATAPPQKSNGTHMKTGSTSTWRQPMAVCRLNIECHPEGNICISLIEPAEGPNSTGPSGFERNKTSLRALIAPGGHLVDLVSHSIVDDSRVWGESVPSLRLSSPKLRGRPWRQTVSSGLKFYGLSSPSPVSTGGWSLVRVFPYEAGVIDEVNCTPSEWNGTCFEWPTKLCIAFANRSDNGNLGQAASEDDEHNHVSGLEWFKTLERLRLVNGFELLPKFDEKAVDGGIQSFSTISSDASKKLNEVNSQNHEVRPSTARSQQVQNDASGVSTTYVTPPGSQTNYATPRSSSVDFTTSQVGPTFAAILPSGGFSLPKEESLMPARQIVPTQQDELHGISRAAENDVYEAADVTEADFNFFDEPNSGRDKEMLDPSKKDGEAERQPSPADAGADEAQKRNTPADEPSASQPPMDVPKLAPLSPNSVQQRLHHFTTIGEKENFLQDPPSFSHLEFSSRLRLSDVKYNTEGRFAVPEGLKHDHKTRFTAKPPPTVTSDIPRITPASMVKVSGNEQAIVRHRNYDGKVPVVRYSNTHFSDDDSSALAGASDDSFVESLDAERPHMTVRPKKKRPKGADAFPRNIEQLQKVEYQESETENNEKAVLLVRHLLQPRTCPIVLSDRQRVVQRDFSPFLPIRTASGEQTLSPQEAIAVAQILAHQVLFAHLVEPLRPGPVDSFENIRQLRERSALQDFVFEAFPEAQSLPAVDLASNKDSSDEKHGVGEALFLIEPPTLRLKKASSDWDFLPTAAPFWETLGLVPSSGPKDVIAWCIFPDSPLLEQSVKDFVRQVSSMYHAHRLGRHGLAKDENGKPGLVPVWTAENASVDSVMQAFQDCFEGLGTRIAAGIDHACNIVLYVMNPFPDPSFLLAFCTYFQFLQQALHSSVSDTPAPHIALESIPISTIASFTAPRFLTFSQAATIAHNVYNRMPLAPSTSPTKVDLPIPSSTSIQLTAPTPTTIPFSLSSDPVQDLFKQNSVLHIAYAVSPSGAWISAAWTDDTGAYQYSANYDASDHELEEVLDDIWDTTLEIISARYVRWRIFIAKVGVDPLLPALASGSRKGISAEETGIWNKVLSDQDRDAVEVSPTLLLVDPDPDTIISPPSISIPSSAPNSPSTAKGFAVAMEPIDPSAQLVDITDTTHGILLAYPQNISPSNPNHESALASGFLMRHGAADRGADYELCGVHVVLLPGRILQANEKDSKDAAARGRGRAREVLREVLVKFRGLALLARYQLDGLPSCNDDERTRKGTAPWHVVTADRSAKGLERCLPDGCAGLLEENEIASEGTSES